MSVISTRSKLSNISSILKSSNSIKSGFKSNKAKVRFQLPYTKKVQTILLDFLNRVNIKEYEDLVCLIRDAELFEEDIRLLLTEATDCISLLDNNVRLFVEAILRLQWTKCCEAVVSEYNTFIVNLLAAHSYHAKFVIDAVVRNFLPDSEDPEWIEGVPSDEDCRKCANVHYLINTLLRIVPMCAELLMQSLVSQYPYITKNAHIHEYYLHNLLWILDYRPDFQKDIFRLLFLKLVLLDVNAPREVIERTEREYINEDIFEIDGDKESETAVQEKMKHPIAHTLDICMDKLLNYILAECHDVESGKLNWNRAKGMYLDILKVFDDVLLPTFNIHHVQFIMFCLCCFKPTICEGFVNYLWKKVCTPNLPSVHRQAAVSYISSLLARGSFVALSMLKEILKQMADWIHMYIGTQDGLECVNSDVRIHTVFYSVCQSLFYLVVFRHRDLVRKKKHITFLQSLNLAKIVTCRLNPLRVCQQAIVQNFAAITRTYQLAYCYSVMEHNSRNVMTAIYRDDKGSFVVSNNTLDTYFPFDPYLLVRSGKKIYPFYVDYESYEDEDGHRREFEMDDFLPNDSSNQHRSYGKFSYGRSPGFKHKK